MAEPDFTQMVGERGRQGAVGSQDEDVLFCIDCYPEAALKMIRGAGVSRHCAVKVGVGWGVGGSVDCWENFIGIVTSGQSCSSRRTTEAEGCVQRGWRRWNK